MLTYLNTPDPITKISPAIAVFARPINDLIPVLPGKLQLHSYWDRLLDDRETTMAARSATELGKWSEHTRPLPQLQIGDHVRVQNQTGPFPRRWDKTGTVIEVKQFHQYWVRMSGSGRATLRNRKFLRNVPPLPHPSPNYHHLLPRYLNQPPRRLPFPRPQPTHLQPTRTPSPGFLCLLTQTCPLGAHWRPLGPLYPLSSPPLRADPPHPCQCAYRLYAIPHDSASPNIGRITRTNRPGGDR